MQYEETADAGGRLDIVGLGPGGPSWMVRPARDSIRKAEVVVGYTTYIELVRPLLSSRQKILSTGMRKEIERCRMAVEYAVNGSRVALVCSGDPGIYGLSGLAFELMERFYGASVARINVIPGISALNACSSLLGAPLVHDFAVISLSDLLTPWGRISRRIEAAAIGDFVIVFYNPRSKRRQGHLKKATDIILKYRSGRTPAGVVRRAMRQGQSTEVTTLSRICSLSIDMQSTVIIGNSESYISHGKIITPRGYHINGKGI